MPQDLFGQQTAMTMAAKPTDQMKPLGVSTTDSLLKSFQPMPSTLPAQPTPQMPQRFGPSTRPYRDPTRLHFRGMDTGDTQLQALMAAIFGSR